MMSESTVAPKKEVAKAETTASSESSSPSSDGGGSAGGTSSGGGGRPISYFSSVSTNAYRTGWDAIFRNGEPAPRIAAKPRRKARPAPATLELDISELEPPLRAQLEDAFRREAKARRLAFDRREKRWRLVCELGG